MANKIDPQLALLTEQSIGGLRDLDGVGRFGLESVAEGGPEADDGGAALEAVVLVQFAGDPDELTAVGLHIRSIAGDVVTGTIALANVEALAELATVERVESSRMLYGELDVSLVETRANLVHTGPPGRRGAGVIVGIVDSGIDFTHPSFRRPDGTSRILFIWDQFLTARPGETTPAPFGYGVEYSKAQIDAAIVAADPFASVRHRDVGIMHGTHVAGIAAGDGSAAGDGRPAFTFIGVAPEADIIVVASRGGPEGLGTSANTLDGVNYIYQKAASLSKAAAVNMSLGDNLGPHDGTSLLERGLDNLLGGAGRAFVKSAGNAGADNIHAQGNCGTGGTTNIGFNEPAGNNTPDQIDLWYDGADTWRVSVVDSAGNISPIANVGTVVNHTFPGGNTVRIDHRNNDPFNGDRRAFITIQPGAAGNIRAGNWILRVTSVASPSGGRFDAWIQRGPPIPRFLAPHVNAAMTISTPGTAFEVITAASYITKGAGVGSLSSFSSRGPTRDGRAAPTLAAPGESIISAAGHNGGDPYKPMGGTSMAAPHITGTLALMLQKNKNRTQAQLKACLESTARSDAQTGPVPNTAWGAGKLDAKAAVDCVPATGTLNSVIVACQRSVLQPQCPVASVAITACPSQLVVACGQPSQITLCQPSVVTICQSQTITCQQPSVATICATTPVTCRRSLVDACPSTLIACLQTAVNCPQVTQVNCPQLSAVTACPSLGGGGCNSFAGCPSFSGCGDPLGPIGNPVVNPGIAQPINPGTFNPGTFNPGNINIGNIGRRGPSDAGEGLEEGDFYEYDETWFDSGEQG